MKELTYEYLKSMRDAKKTIVEISQDSGWKDVTISKYLRNYNLTRRKLKEVNTNAKNILTYEYLQSVHLVKAVKEIAQETNCSASCVQEYLHKYNLSVKNSRIGKQRGELNSNWKGGVYGGNPDIPWDYKYVRVGVNKYKREHIFVIENFISRPLKKYEVVHHIDGNIVNNDLTNLVILSKTEHDCYHKLMKMREIDYSKHTIPNILKTLYPDITQEFIMYAELTRIASVRDRG
jgi:hypothetical protein